MFNQLPPKPGMQPVPGGLTPAPAGGPAPGASAVPVGVGPHQTGDALGKHLGVLNDTRGGGKAPTKGKC